MSRPVPFLDSGAFVNGRAASGISWLLTRSVNRGELAAFPPEVRAEVEAVVEAINLAAVAWKRRTAAVSGRTAEVSAPLPSQSDREHISVVEAALVLNVSERRVRDMAAGGLGRRVGGRWLLARADVEAEARRRGAA